LSSDEETYDEEEEETKLLNAEQVTMIASSFLKRLGNKQGLKPIKASLEEDDIYTVEIGLPKKTAIVQINAATENIEEYEIKKIEQQEEASSFPVPLTPKNIMILGGTAAASVVLSALLGISSLLPSLL
jgi:hypothetical protein